MECRLVVRSVEGIARWTVSEWLAVQVLAGLSTEPKTWSELEDALQWYRPGLHFMTYAQRLERGASLAEAVANELPDRWCVIDLIGRTVVVSGEFCPVKPRGGFQAWRPDWERSGEDWDRVSAQSAVWSQVAYLHLPPHWKFFRGRADWPEVVDRRYRKALSEPLLDAHDLLWGEPLWKFLSEQVHRLPDSKRSFRRLSRLHAQWLTTPQEALEGYTLRDVLLCGGQYAERDLEYRRIQWGKWGQPPQPIRTDSYTYRYGPYADVHRALHCDYVRTLLEKAWTARKKLAKDTLGRTVSLLEHAAQCWWDRVSDVSDSGLTNAELWRLLRQRVPPTVQEDLLFPDCPICRASKALDLGPTFECICWSVDEPELARLFAHIPGRDDWFPWQSSDDFQEPDDSASAPQDGEDPRRWIEDQVQNELREVTTLLFSGPPLVEDSPGSGDAVAGLRWSDSSDAERGLPAQDMLHRELAAEQLSHDQEWPSGWSSTFVGSAIGAVSGSQADEGRPESDLSGVTVERSSRVDECFLDPYDTAGNRLMVIFPLGDVVHYLQELPDARHTIDRLNELVDAFCGAASGAALREAAQRLECFLESIQNEHAAVEAFCQECHRLLKPFVMS
jgi:hypothetical protein